MYRIIRIFIYKYIYILLFFAPLYTRVKQKHSTQSMNRGNVARSSYSFQVASTSRACAQVKRLNESERERKRAMKNLRRTHFLFEWMQRARVACLLLLLLLFDLIYLCTNSWKTKENQNNNTSDERKSNRRKRAESNAYTPWCVWRSGTNILLAFVETFGPLIFVFFFVWIWFESMKNVPATVPYKVDVYSETNRRAKKWANPSTFGETTHRKWPNAHQFGKVFCGCSLLKWSVGPDMGLVWSLNIRYSIVRNSTHAHRRDEHISTSDRHDHDIFMCLKKWKKKNALWSTPKLFRVFCFFFVSRWLPRYIWLLPSSFCMCGADGACLCHF